MATLKLTIHSHSDNTDIGDLIHDISLDTSSLTDAYTFNDKSYKLSLVTLDINMQMYRPSEILAEISIHKTYDSDWEVVKRDNLKVFKDKKVSISSDNYLLGDDFYVHEVIPECYSGYMHLKLRIFSPDKVLTLKNTSRTFVGKRLSEILTSELAKYRHPSDTADKEAYIKYDTGNLRVLKYGDDNKYEHMFPFLVQYNESTYDLLARTANRWGEFMYYRDGALCFGYNDKKKAVKKEKYHKITYPSYNTDGTLTNGDQSGLYHQQAMYDKTVVTPVQKSPFIVKGELGMFGGLEDKYLMKKAASFLGNGKDLMTWLVNNLVNDGVSLAEAVAYKKQLNNDLNEGYFNDDNKKNHPLGFGKEKFVQYGSTEEEKDAFYEFTEFQSQYNASKYQTILEGEKTAGDNIVQIDFDTTSPDVKLGDLITVEGEQLIVVGITIRLITETMIKENGNIEDVTKMKFAVTALERKDSTSIFYPTMLPSGHVRYSGPQKGVIWNEDDPTLQHRVRVLFDWQILEEKNNDTKKTEKKLKDADTTPSPWLIYAAKGDGKASTGRHVDKTEVLLGFIGGNIERPYVIGSIQNKVAYDSTIDVDIDTDQGHFFRLTDGSRGAGLSSFLFGALSPACGTIADFVPNFAFNLGESAHLEGGFTMSDYYGIYKISGSSDQRNITISSPWGDVNMNAFTGITISAPNGDVKISGKNVTIEAGNNLSLVSGTNVSHKFLADKKYSGSTPSTVLMTVSAAVVNNLAKRLTLLDLSIVRSVVEIVMRPVEGALTVKSNRFLKLEAGKNACEYPMSAYNEKKREKMEEDVEEASKALVKSLPKKTVLRWGLEQLFSATKDQAKYDIECFNVRYKKCREHKQGLEDAIAALNKWSENRSQKPCADYAGLKNVLWDTDIKKDKIEEKDLNFKDDLVGIKNDAKTLITEGRETKRRVDVLSERKSARDKVVRYATQLRKCIIEMMFDKNEKQVEANVKKVMKNPPKDASKIMYEAECKKNNPNLPIYKLTDDVKNLLLQENPLGDNDEKLIRRVYALNMLDKFKLIEGLNKPTVTDSSAAEAGNIMNDGAWQAFVAQIKINDAGALEDKTNFEKWKDDMKGALDTFVGDLNPVEALSKLKGPWDERQSWDNNNRGSILFGANNQTYRFGTGDNPQMKLVKKLKPKVPTAASNEFLQGIRTILNGL